MYKNMDVAVNLFNHAKGPVGIVIDSDLDGACSAAIAYMLCIENGLENIRIYSHAGKELIGISNYCPHCGYEYEPWDGTTFK